MKKVLAMILALVMLFCLAACSNTDKNKEDAPQQGGTNQQQNQNDNNGTASQYKRPQTKQPGEAFTPYGKWVWVGNEKFTMTLNEDGTAVFSDNAENSYINLYPRLKVLWESNQNTFSYQDGDKAVKVMMKLDDRENESNYEIKIGNGYYILAGGNLYSFVREKDFEAAHKVFLEEPVRDSMYDRPPIKVGETAEMDAQSGVELKLTNVEMDSNYDVKIYCTVTAPNGFSTFDWMGWTLYIKGEGGMRSDTIRFYDLNGQEANGLGAGQSIDGYLEIKNVKSEQCMAWFGEMKACVYLSGMSLGEGCFIDLPAQPA